MTHPVRPWTLALVALTLGACGGSTTSTPPLKEQLTADAGPSDDEVSDAGAKVDSEPEPDLGDASPDEAGETVREVECPGWVVPDSTASCSQNSMNNQCSANCRSGTRYWQSQCQDGVCACSFGMEAKCTCEMEPGACQSCCPGMPR